MSPFKALAAAMLVVAVSIRLVEVAGASSPIRIGASASRTGAYAALGQNQLRGYELCVRHTNERGGVLGRTLELVVEDDRSDPATAVRIYERLITRDRIDLVLGPYGTPMSRPVAEVTEKHRMPMVAPTVGTTSLFKEGRKFIFMIYTPAELHFEGFIELAARNDLKTVALIGEDSLYPRAVVTGAADLARKRGLQVVFTEAYPRKTTDFTAILTRVRSSSADALGAATFFEDAVAITRQMKELNLNPKMFAATVGVPQPEFHKRLERSAEFAYGPSQWEPEFVTIRAGGLIPIARQYPGAREFVEAHRRAYPGADLSYQTAAGYAGCQVLTEAVKRAGSLDGDAVRDAILKLDFNTVFGAFRVDADGLQTAHKMVTIQWQDGKRVIVWPEDLAQAKPRIPAPPWSQR
ncbi:MAG TPA: amino acid ABC transporter substrate-binding protein [Methylomirabilota bacterium]